MKLLRLYDFSWSDAVRTEQAILTNLESIAEKTSTEFTVAYYSWSHSINTLGLAETQQKIYAFQKYSEVPSRLIFICQHILVERLDWGESPVFSPHATFQNGFLPVAHYSQCFSNSSQPFMERQILASFVGSYLTHDIRRRLAEILVSRKDCLAIDTGTWHYEKSAEKQYECEKIYINSLCNSKFVVCPRGTGPSTIRIWEALSSGCIPIIISDELRLPSPLDKIVPIIPSYSLGLLPLVLDHLSQSIYSPKLNKLHSKLKYIHDASTSINSLHVPILVYLGLVSPP